MVSLEPGTYYLTFWASTNSKEMARVQASVGDTVLDAETVGEEWTKFGGRFDIVIKKTGIPVKLWNATDGVGVWFDDVELKRVRR